LANAFSWQSLIKSINVVMASMIVTAINIFIHKLDVVQQLILFFGGGGGAD
jgi:hypothetical protein